MLRSFAARKFLPARHPFRTSRDSKPGVENVFLVVEQDGVQGCGESSPNRYFGESAEDVHLRLLGLADFLKRQKLESFHDVARIWKQAEMLLRPSRAALCAVDLALWDLWGKLAHETASQLAWKEPPRSLITAVTLSLSHPEEEDARLEEVAGFPLVKVKMNATGDLTLVKRLRKSGTRVLVDANAAWNLEQCLELLPQLQALGVEAIEQPLPPDQKTQMKELRNRSPLPFLADESCAIPQDVEGAADLFSGINIKLVKCGGLTPALQMLHLARRRELKVMVGCMLESGLLISAGMTLAQKADWADLDGSWLLAQDPFLGPRFQEGFLFPALSPGLGAEPMTGLKEGASNPP
jgi:L-alanine-DL-glutamate epimerase-like enolase superfamily enzyme